MDFLELFDSARVPFYDGEAHLDYVANYYTDGC